MAIIDTLTQKVNILPTGIPTPVHLSQSENGRTLSFEIIGGSGELPAGSVVTLTGTKPDGVVYSAVGTLSGNIATFEEDVQLTAAAGVWPAKIEVTNGGHMIATGRISFTIDADPVAPGSVPSESELDGLVAQAAMYAENARSAAYGSPLTAATAADMIDTTRVYVYTGNETGMENGHWYYWEDGAWKDGGIYNAAAVQTDTSLSIPGMAADAKATGEAIAAEAAAREQADTALQTAIDTKADTSALTAETAAREQADADLKADLNKSVTDLKSAIKDVGGITFDLSQGYYNSSGLIVDNANYHHTDVLTENFVRKDFTITPNSVVVWENGVVTFKYWGQISQLTTFDSIAYNFQTPLSSVVCITPSYLSAKVSSLDSDVKIEKTKTGQEFTLTQGYYNPSGIYVDDAGYGCTAKLYETSIRKGFIPTPNSVVAWNKGTVIHRYWADVDQITTFDTIVYNFQTTDRKAYDLTPSYLSGLVDKLVAYAGGTMDFAGKKVAIIGDSISTNGDYSAQNPYGNVPEIIIETADVGVTLQAYPTYYDIGVTVGGHEITLSDVGSELTFTPTASDVGKMVGKPLSYNPASSIVWWEIVQQELGIVPIPVCWSGASITSHNNDENNLKTSHAWHDATIRKCGIRTPGSMDRTAPDIILIYRGTNDFSHYPYAKITSNYYDSVPWRYPDTDVISDGYGYLQGLCLTVKKLRAAYPMAVIFLCTLNTFKRIDDSLFAIDNDRATLPQYSKAIRDTADFLGCGVIEFDKDGITYENCYIGGYITDSEAHPTHPSDKGHKVMGNKAILDLVTRCNSMI